MQTHGSEANDTPTERREFGRLFQRNGTWYVRYRAGGRERTETLGTKSRAVAERKAAIIGDRVGRGDYQASDVRRVAFKDLETLILTDYQMRGLRSLPRLNSALAHLRETFGTYRTDGAHRRGRPFLRRAFLRKNHQAGRPALQLRAPAEGRRTDHPGRRFPGEPLDEGRETGAGDGLQPGDCAGVEAGSRGVERARKTHDDTRRWRRGHAEHAEKTRRRPPECIVTPAASGGRE